MYNSIVLMSRIIRYNLKIVFAGRFFLFLLAAIAFYILFMLISVYDNVEINIGFLYNITFFPALLLIFYPMVFGIQKDDDARMLEILFGIPDILVPSMDSLAHSVRVPISLIKEFPQCESDLFNLN